jgi:hypothetical protein
MHVLSQVDISKAALAQQMGQTIVSKHLSSAVSHRFLSPSGDDHGLTSFEAEQSVPRYQFNVWYEFLESIEDNRSFVLPL